MHGAFNIVLMAIILDTIRRRCGHKSQSTTGCDFCHQAHLGVQVEVGSTLTPDGSQSRPADVLVGDWIAGRFAAFDFTVSSPLSVTSLDQACTTSGSTAQSSEARKHYIIIPS